MDKNVLTCDAKLWKRPMDMKDMLLFGEYYEDGAFHVDRMIPIDETMMDFLSHYEKIEINFRRQK